MTKKVIPLLAAVGSLLLAACAPTAAPAATAVPARATTAATATTAPPPAGTGTTATAADAGAGKTAFEASCNVCHPGGGKAVGPEVKGKAPDLLKKKVREGGGGMPAFGPGQISDAQLDVIAVYVASLK